jgi:acetyl esterase/lipase
MRSDSAGFVPAGAHEKIAAALLRFGAHTAWRPALSPRISFVWQRWWMRQLARFTWPRAGIERQAGIAGGVSGEWMRPSHVPQKWVPVLRKRTCANEQLEQGDDSKKSHPAPAAQARRATILYLHGGGYCIGSHRTHRALTSHLAHAAGLAVFTANYRLAPEHPFPAALEDAVACFQSLQEAGPVIIAGDSAGAGLALATTLAARQRQIAAPAALVLFSPWTDLSPASIPDDTPRDAMLRADWLRACANSYLAGEPATTPLASPLLGDLHGLPPTLIQAGSDELLCGQALRTCEALRAAGCDVVCEIIPNRWHAFQLLAGSLPSADAAIARAERFIARAIAA